MEELEIQAIKKVIENIEWERDHWGHNCYQCEQFPQVLHTTPENESVCWQCIENEKKRLQKIEERLNKWNNKLKEKMNEQIRGSRPYTL